MAIPRSVDAHIAELTQPVPLNIRIRCMLNILDQVMRDINSLLSMDDGLSEDEKIELRKLTDIELWTQVIDIGQRTTQKTVEIMLALDMGCDELEVHTQRLETLLCVLSVIRKNSKDIARKHYMLKALAERCSRRNKK